jgi:hypothetical protein
LELIGYGCRNCISQDRARGDSIDRDTLAASPLIFVLDTARRLFDSENQLTSLAQDQVRLSRAALEAPYTGM